MSRSIGAPTMAKGIRIPVNDPCLDELLCGVQAHADWLLSGSPSPKLEEVARQYEERNQLLYKLAERVRADALERPQTDPCLDELLAAIQEHAEWRLLTHGCFDLESYVREYKREDRELYDLAAMVRLQAFERSPHSDVYLDPGDLEAVLTGRKTVMRIPVEHNRTRKILGSYYKKGGPYPLVSTPRDAGPTLLELIPSRTLRILDVRMEPLGKVDDAEARLEGHADRPSFLESFWERYGHALFDWAVWRYEFVHVEP
jgi:hypothetical protein